MDIWLAISITLLYTVQYCLSAAVEPSLRCPAQCTCYNAPLHSAAFVSRWTTGVDTPPDAVDNNDVIDHSAVSAASGPAADASVPLDEHGLHVTCAIYPDTNLTHTVSLLPHDTMVLSLLQAATTNCTVIEGNQLAGLAHLKALHVKGFTAKDREHNDVTMVLADDVLKPLVNLQILDLCYVRLVPQKVAQRLRRHIQGPLYSTTMVDMPLGTFLRYAEDLEVQVVPDEIRNGEHDVYESISQDKEETALNSTIIREEYSLVLLNNKDKISVDSSSHRARDQPYFAPFTSQTNLKYLRIAYAHLVKFGSEMFVGLLNLHTVILEHNDIKILPGDIFAHTPNVRHLNLGYNSILSLEPKSLQGLTHLVSLNLEFNEMAVTGPATLPHLPNLKTLNLRGNPIRNILPDSFIFTNSTETLIIGSSEIPTRLHADSFSKLINLKTLKILNYTSPTFRGEFLGGTQLEELTIHGSISAIDFDAFAKVKNIKKLILSNSGLTRISVDAFFGLSQLQVLDLSNNEISELTPGVFDHLSNLQELYLQNNNLTTLIVGIFTPLNLKILRINHNPWDCSCNLLQLNPSLTNSVIHPGVTMCHVNAKQQTVCGETLERLVYDTRVAPKCHSPPEFRYQDVYTVASRYLKCSKYHWDPLSYTDDPQTTTTPTKQKAATTRIQPVPLQQKLRRLELVNWRPLTYFTPVPIIPIDLLNIAEKDDLAEVVDEPITVMPMSDHSETAKVEEEIEVTTMSKAEQKRQMIEARNRHRARKMKIKRQMKLERARGIIQKIKKT